MPAERSRGSRRSGADGNQLVWTMPVEPASRSGISFATNVTPITFNDSDAGSSSPTEIPESTLFPYADDSSQPKRPAHSKKKPENHIPRPPNAFILFRSSFIKSQHVSTEVETNHSTLSKIIGLTWQSLPEDERQVWHIKAKAALDEHKRKFPQYAFRPLHSKGKGGMEKRKVREVGPKDIKRCAKIAELLVEGKKGQELDAAIQEFDKTHVPEVVTRFEDPITERTYKRERSTPEIKIDDCDEDEDVPFPSTPLSSPSKRSSRLSEKPTNNRRQRSVSLGPLPPLVDPDQIPPHLLPKSRSMDYLPPHPQEIPDTIQTSVEDSYSFTSKQEPSFDFNTFTFDTLPNSPGGPTFTNNGSMDSLLPDGPYEDTIGVFSNESLQQPERRPSLSINTSFAESSTPLQMMEDWTRSNSPMSAESLSIPQTPCYPESPMPAQYSPAFNPYQPSLHHTVSPLSSLSSSSSYDDLSSMYSPDCHSQPPNSATSCHDFAQYTHEDSVYVHSNDESRDFTGSYESQSLPTMPILFCDAQVDDIMLQKAQAQCQYEQSSFNLDFQTFVMPSAFSMV